MNKLEQKVNGKPRAVVIGLDCMTGLQTLRILSKRGISVIAIAKNGNHFACKSRHCHELHVADTSNDEFIKTLEKIGPKLEEKAVLYPCTDMSVLRISRNRQRLEKWYHVVLPDSEVVEMLMDKISFIKFAQKENLPIPKTFFLKNRSDVEKSAQELTFPCILKPPIKSPKWESKTKKKVFKIFDPDELFETYDLCSGWADILMVQDCVEGTDANLYSCNCYFNSASEPVVTFIARKLRQWPVETGTSCLGEECRNDLVLEESLRLFRKVGYRGLGYLEMKKDARTGKHYIIEPNIGRPTGRSAIAEAGGVDLLYAKYCDVVGLQLPKNLEQKYSGVKWIYFRRDFQSAFTYWRRGELSLVKWFRSLIGKKGYAVFSWSDPKPFFSDFKSTFSSNLFHRNNGIQPVKETRPIIIPE